MAYALTGSGNAGSAGGDSLTVSATFVAGETVIVCVTTTASNTATITVSDTVNTYSSVSGRLSISGFGAAGGQIFKADNVAAGTVTITASASGGISGVSFFRYTGLASGAVQVTQSDHFDAGGSPSTQTGTAMTPTAQPAMLFSFCVDQNGSAPVAVSGGGFTDRGPLSNITTQPSDAEDKRLTSTSAVSATWTWTGTSYDHYEYASIIISEALVITGPTSQQAKVGGTATFTVTASGATSYQWQDDSGGSFANVSGGSGATTASYTTATITSGFNGRRYRCVIDSTNSNSATLDILLPGSLGQFDSDLRIAAWW